MKSNKIALLHIKGKENVSNSVNVFVKLSVGILENTTYTILKNHKVAVSASIGHGFP